MTDSNPQRLLTVPLAVFLLVTVGTLFGALVLRTEEPDLEGAIELLADGDLDREERDRALSLVVELGSAADRLRGRWAAVLAAVALQDRAAFDRCEQRLGRAHERIVPAERQKWLSLGDSLLANMLAAMLAEASEDREGALRHWRQVALQSRFVGNPVAAELAKEGQARLQ